MPIPFTCPFCGHQTDVADEYAGQSGPCSACGKRITVPLPGQVAYGSESPAALPRVTRSAGWVGGALGVLAVGLFFCCGGGFILSIFLPTIQSAQETARRAQCAANLTQIGVAMRSYYADYHSFPPAVVADEKGRPLHSWRVLLLPYLDSPLAGQYRFDEPWNGPNNLRLQARIPAVYRCPSDLSASAKGITDYVVIAGPGTIFDGANCTKTEEITDGTADTLLVVELVESDINWLEPRDLRIEQISGSINAPKGDEISSEHLGGANVLAADGTVYFLNEDRAGQDVRALATKAGEEPLSLP